MAGGSCRAGRSPPCGRKSEVSVVDASRSAPVVRAQGLTKRFRNLTAVDGVSFEIMSGECFGFLGPNGAGKTTTVRMIYCFTPPTAGGLTVFGLDVGRSSREIKVKIGVCPQEDNLDPDFSVEKNLRVYGRYFGLSGSAFETRLESLLAFAQLRERRRDKVDNLSGGMKRRLLLARALVNSPRLLILDEPTTGLDPQARHLIWDRIRDLRREGVTIILTTHYMEEAAQLCDRLMVVDHGRIVELGAPDELVRRHVGREVLEMWDLDGEQRGWLEGSAGGFEFFGNRAFLYGEGVEAVLTDLRGRGGRFERFLIRPAGLEDVFLRLTGRGLRD
ncbi:ATP-binding cassette domain-containing protein [bacterium]|nr:ATP-binding cassette domain-containing protein [candidate division CSSED10-310 bacterium]